MNPIDQLNQNRIIAAIAADNAYVEGWNDALDAAMRALATGGQYSANMNYLQRLKKRVKK